MPTGEVILPAGEGADKAARTRLQKAAKDEIERVNTDIQAIEAEEQARVDREMADLDLQRDATLEAERERLKLEAEGTKEDVRRARDEIERLKPGLMLPETSLDGMNLRDLDRKYGSAVRGSRLFGAGMGAEAIRELIQRMDLEGLRQAAPQRGADHQRPAPQEGDQAPARHRGLPPSPARGRSG